MNEIPATADRRNSADTIRSYFLARKRSGGLDGSSRSSGASAPPGVRPRPPPGWARSSSSPRAGGGVPITRRGSGRRSPFAGPTFPELVSLPLIFCFCPLSLCPLFTALGGDPHGREDQCADPAEPGDEPLGNRPDPAEAEPSGVRLGARLEDVRDDVALLLRCDRVIAEHRHGLGAGEHRLVDLPLRRVGQRRRVLASGERPAS